MPRKQRAMSGSAAARIHMETNNIRLRSGSAGHRPLSGDEDDESDREGEPIEVSQSTDINGSMSLSRIHVSRIH